MKPIPVLNRCPSHDDVLHAAIREEYSPVEEGDQRARYFIASEEFILDTFYVPTKKLGNGSYGFVCAARDMRNNKKVAIKKIHNVFRNTYTACRALREIKLLRHLEHPNIVSLVDILPPRSQKEFDDVYIATEFMRSDLGKVIQSSAQLSEDQIAYIICQVLRALHYMHSSKCIHRDIKPGNILINADCSVKLCDLGLSRCVQEEAGNVDDMTEYVVTRHYRAPEVMLGNAYDYKLDIWSVGCVFAELLTGQTLFPGEHYVDQLTRIVDLVGTPTKGEIERIVTNDSAKEYVMNMKIRQRQPFSALFPGASASALDLLEQILVFDPDQRPSALGALQHEFFTKFTCEQDLEVDALQFDYSFEKMCRTQDNIRDLIIEEVHAFRPDTGLSRSSQLGRRMTRKDSTRGRPRRSSSACDPRQMNS